MDLVILAVFCVPMLLPFLDPETRRRAREALSRSFRGG